MTDSPQAARATTVPSRGLRRLFSLSAGWPRESRDTLFLLGITAWIVLLQAPHIPLWASALAGGLLTWRAAMTWQHQPLPGMPVRVALLVACVGGTALHFHTIAGRDAGSTLIVLLLVLKTFELRARRDAFVIFFLGFFTLLSHFFYSQSLATATGILIGVIALLAGLVNAQLRAGYPPLRQSFGIALRMAAWGTPLMLVLFVLFPRFAPLWGMPSNDMARTGLSGDMRLGNIARLVEDDSVAFRVRFEGEPPPQPFLYFRGPVMERFDGHEWHALQEPFPFRGPPATTAGLVAASPASVRYEVLLQPHQKQWLLLLDATVEPPQLPAGWSSRQMPAYEWITNRPVTDVLRYRATSALHYVAGADTSAQQLRTDLYSPAAANPRTRALAQSLRADPRLAQAGPDALVAAVMERLRTGGYTYTLEPGPTGTDPADTFWFDSKQGFCEHIANAFVVLMRDLGIPARVVTGYQGGERNPVDGLWTVRQRDAHAWAEVWLPRRGWVRIDPTSAVSPGRTGSLARLEPRPGALGSMVERLDPGFAPRIGRSLRNLWDAANTRWNSWIINYTQDRQFDLLRQLGFGQVNWTTLVQVLAGLLIALALAGSLWSLLEHRTTDPWLRLLARARQRLAQWGLPATLNQPASTPGQLRSWVLATFAATPARKAWIDWLTALETWRYAARGASPAELTLLRRRARQLPSLGRPRPAAPPATQKTAPKGGR